MKKKIKTFHNYNHFRKNLEIIMTLSLQNEILFETPFLENSKNKIVTNVLNYVNSSPEINILKDLDQCDSAEGGFTLPLTNDMKNAVRAEVDSYCLLDFHNCRSFRFIKRDNKITGIRCKDGLRFWTETERMLLNDVINFKIRGL